jgi:MFS family permease
VAQSAISLSQGLQVDAAAHDAGQRALRAAFIGFFVDMFDVYLPVVALGPAMSYFQPASLSPALKSTLFYTVFALSLVGRPVGATLFGHYGDKIGRRRVTIISMGGFALATLLIGLLPGYETWGMSSIVILTLLRFLDGIFLGGEYTAPIPWPWSMRPRRSGENGRRSYIQVIRCLWPRCR